MKSRQLTLIAVFAALYAVLTWLFAPLSFLAMQFRVSEALKPAIAKRWELAIAFAVGNFLGNLISPFGGFGELLFMPIMNLIGGLVAFYVSRKNYWITSVIYGLIIAGSVSFMLFQFFNVPLITTFPLLVASEIGVMLLGTLGFRVIERSWKWFA